MTHDLPLQLILGPPGHGVVDYALDIAGQTVLRRGDAPVAHVDGLADALAHAERSARVHVHVTDRLWGATAADAAEAVERLSETTGLSITLHDVPQESDGAGFARRVDAYRRFVDAADTVVVNSAHENALVAAHLGRSAHAIIPLGTRRGEAPDGAAEDEASGELAVLIAGFVYPGKGHAAAIDAAAVAAARLRATDHAVDRVVVRAIGRASPGHDADVEALAARAREVGVAFEVTGFLPADGFAAHLRASGIPLAAHEHVSASRSILDWIEAGRRPLVVRSRYAEETAELRPGTLALYDPTQLADELAACRRDPGLTRLHTGTPLGPTVSDAAQQYLERWAA